MEIKIIEDSKKKLVIELVGQDHTLCNIIKEGLNKEKSVTIASYKIEHPLTSNPIMLIEADNPKKVLEMVIKKTSNFFSELEKKFKSIK